METNFYRRLLDVPLFQGFSKEEYYTMAERARLDFRTLAPNTTFLRQYERCDRYSFIVGGEVKFSRESDSRDYVYYEWQNRPSLLQPECLYGLSTRYTHTVSTVSQVTLFEVDKETVFNLLMKLDTFRLNYMNLLSYEVQKAKKYLWNGIPKRLERRFVDFLVMRSLRPAGHKQLKIRQTRLAAELSATAPAVSQMLKELDAKGLVQNTRWWIDIPQLELLVQAY